MNYDSGASSDEDRLCNLPLIPSNKQIEELQLASSSSKPSQQLNITEMNRPSKPHKRFSIWSDVLLEENLAENLHSAVKVDLGPGHLSGRTQNRDVESYEYWRKNNGRLDKKKDKRSERTTTKSWLSDKLDKSSKSRRDDRKDMEEQEKYSVEQRRTKRTQKKKARKHRTDEEKISMDIASKLKEPKIALIRKAVAVIGIEMAQRMCGETLTIEEAGGMLTSKGARRRSPGGVFFHLIKCEKSVSEKQKEDLFAVDQTLYEQRKKLSKKAKKKLRKAAGKHKKKDTGINAPEASNLDVSLPLENLSIASPPPSTSSSSVVQVIQAGLQDITI